MDKIYINLLVPFCLLCTSQTRFLRPTAMVTFFLCIPYTLLRVMRNSVLDSVDIQPVQHQGKVWIERIGKAHDNAIENLGIFALLLVLISVTDANNNITAMVAQLLFWTRLLHLLTNITDNRWLRDITSTTSIAALIILATQLI